MPLIKSKSKKAMSENIKTEMDAGKPKKQSIAIAYSVNRRAKDKKKMAKGGEVSAADEMRPMPDNTYDDSALVSRNSGNKPPKDDQWTDNPTVKQAQKLSITKLSQPKMVGSDAFSSRNRDMRDDENDFVDSIPPQSDKAQPMQRDNEEGPDRQGPEVPDNQKQHDNGRAAYAEGGRVESMENSTADNGGDPYDGSIVDAIRARVRGIAMMALGGEVEDSQVDLSRNADEDLNFEDQNSFAAARKENYSESAGLDALDQPEDSNMKSPDHDEIDVHDKSIVDSIRRKYKKNVR